MYRPWGYTIVYGDKRSAFMGAEDTVAEATDALIRHIQFYRDERGYELHETSLYKLCETCQGSGEVRKHPKRREMFPVMKPCKQCNGSGRTQSMILRPANPASPEPVDATISPEEIMHMTGDEINKYINGLMERKYGSSS